MNEKSYNKWYKYYVKLGKILNTDKPPKEFDGIVKAIYYEDIQNG